jgi:hypothetical protein
VILEYRSMSIGDFNALALGLLNCGGDTREVLRNGSYLLVYKSTSLQIRKSRPQNDTM